MAKKTQSKKTSTGGAVRNSEVELALPVAEPEQRTYVAQSLGRIDLKIDNGPSLDAFRRVYAGLLASGAAFADGRPVVHANDVVRWIFEQVSRRI